MFGRLAGRFLLGLLLTAFAAKGAARLSDLIATKVFGATHTVYLQVVLAVLVGLIGILATVYDVNEHRKARAA